MPPAAQQASRAEAGPGSAEAQGYVLQPASMPSVPSPSATRTREGASPQLPRQQQQAAHEAPQPLIGPRQELNLLDMAAVDQVKANRATLRLPLLCAAPLRAAPTVREEACA